MLVVGLFSLLCLITWGTVSAQHGGGEAAAGHASQAEHSGGSPWSIVFKWANFILLFGGLGWYLRKPLQKFLNSRSNEIQEGLNQAREAKAAATAKLAEMETRMAQLDAAVRALREEASQQAEEERLRILENAQADARKILEMAQVEIEGMRKSARLELKRHVAELAVKLAEERLQTSIGPEEDRRMVERFLQGLENTRN